MRSRMLLGDFLVAYLRRAGVEHIFGLPGDLVLGLFHHFGRNPIRKRGFLYYVATRLRVDLSNSSQPLFRKSASKSHKGWPKATVHKRHLAPHKPAHMDEIRVPDVPRQTMNVVSLWMRPPTPSNAFSRYFLN